MKTKIEQTYILYNPFSKSGMGQRVALALEGKHLDITSVNYEKLFAEMDAADQLIICGGDGTLNHFVNDTAGFVLPKHIYYLPAGTGNDFAFDLGRKDCKEPFEISQYLQNLPTVTVNGKSCRFINGVGYGLDGYCCEEGDRQKAKSNKPVNYTAIAIKGLLFRFKPKNATVCVDGQKMSFRKVWLAPTMKGRAYGGGMLAAPNQDRTKSEVSLLIWCGSGKLATLMAFPSIFKGEHIQKSSMCHVFTGKEIEVTFSEPCALQIDGETILNVTSYRVNV